MVNREDHVSIIPLYSAEVTAFFTCNSQHCFRARLMDTALEIMSDIWSCNQRKTGQPMYVKHTIEARTSTCSSTATIVAVEEQ